MRLPATLKLVGAVKTMSEVAMLTGMMLLRVSPLEEV